MNADRALARWLAGHHAFFLLLQGIILAHRRVEEALADGDEIAARRALAQATRMLEGSAAAMLFAGDMPAECYVVVRESMTPPNVPHKFSGLWSVDHRAMIDGLRALRALAGGLAGPLRAEWDAWKDALDRTYAAHACVCEHFVGDGPSLAMQPGTGQCGRSALQNLEAFRQRTLALVETQRS